MTELIENGVSEADEWCVVTSPKCQHSWRVTGEMIRDNSWRKCPRCNPQKTEKTRDTIEGSE